MSDNQHSLFEQYFDFVKDTEPPDIYHRWCLITCLAALLGKQAWVPFGQFRIFPNQYIMLIGDPGTRKSTAVKMAKKLLAATGYDKFAAEKTYKEKFLMDLEGAEEEDTEVRGAAVMESVLGESVTLTEPKEVFIVADEFNDFMRTGDLDFHSMLGTLWDWDDESTPYKHRLKNSKSVSVYQPTINLLSGNTHTGFSEMFPPQALGQGFLSRMLLIYSDPSLKRFPFPSMPDEKKKKELVDTLIKIKHLAIGAIEITPKAKEMLAVLYNTYEGFDDIRFTSYFTRRYTHLIKLCMLCAVTRLSKLIGPQDVLLANTILTYAEHLMPRALGEFGKAKNADVSNRIIQMLMRATKPMDLPAIWKHVSSDLDRMDDLGKILSGLNAANKIQWVADPRGYLAVRRRLTSPLYVDFSLLKEYKQR